MNGPNDITPQLKAWLKEPVTLPEDGITRVSPLVHDTAQQRGVLPPLRTLWATPGFAFGGIAVTAVAALLIGSLLLALVARPQTAPVPAAASPSVSPSTGPPTWEGVRFEPVEDACASGCEEHPGQVWSVSTDDHGDSGSAEAIAFDATGPPWILSHGTLWQLGSPGAHEVPGSDGSFPIPALVVTPDGLVWVGTGSGLHSFDGEAWTEHWTSSGIVALDVSADGTIHGLGGGRGEGDIIVVRVNEDDVSSETVDVIDRDRWPIALAVDGEDRVWVGAIGSGYLAPVEGESLVAYSDGGEWQTVRPFGDEVDVAAWSLARGPEGALRFRLDAIDPELGYGWYVGRAVGPYWEVHTSSLDGGPDLGAVMALDAGGGPWFNARGNPGGVDAGLLAWRGWTWTRYLPDREFQALGATPDGSVVAATIPGFDEDGELFLLRHDP